MSSQRFYLLGEDPSATTEIEIPASTDEEGLQHLAASHFAVVDHKGKHHLVPTLAPAPS